MKIRRFPYVMILAAVLALAMLPAAQAPEGGEAGTPEFDSCTSILVGRLASVDGSTMTSHSCDSGTDRTWMTIVPNMKHKPGETAKVYYEPKRTKGPNDPDRLETGEIPQVAETYAYLNAAYPIMNEHQLAIGETTIGSRRELISENGIIDAPELYRLVLERAKTAREAIRVADELTRDYGYNDWGECFTFADTKEVWHFEIHGPGKGKKGAVWAAQRVPDDEIGVSANAGRIREIDPGDPDRYLASANVTSLAEEMGYWSKAGGRPFDFTYAYNPDSRTSLYCRRREWRVLSLLAPSLKLNPESENFPFSVKPDKKVGLADLLAIFRDTYGGTEYDMTRTLTAVNRKGETVKSPIATPFMSADALALFRLKRERTICCPAATYLQITQSRDWLPGPLGGVVWIGYDNPATTPHLPFYIGISQMPASYMVDGRWAFSRECAWWAFRTVSRLANFRYQEMSREIEKVWKPIEDKALADQAQFEKDALELYKKDPKRFRERLTSYCHSLATQAVQAYWKLGDDLWLKYSGNF
ncbi:MAG TPA: C69 family dipeptidase [Candidatus Aminicenantes bacterium]|nr:C69 family dipeptidase [Candidatus Aminicenantes bacterium]HRY65793.1 C69 family dipeptidase [Candidatus Aminicenantes bacterium]HRZ72707.1 C69 family dipeptidase [Candidatus Aminicenantes bacterium]